MRNGGSSAFERRPWMGIYIQGWRVELAIGVVLLLALSLSKRLGPSGPLLVGAAGLALWFLRPELRERLSNEIKENHARLWLHMGLWHCAIVGRSGRIPKVVSSAKIPVGYRFLVVLPMGCTSPSCKVGHPNSQPRSGCAKCG